MLGPWEYRDPLPAAGVPTGLCASGYREEMSLHADRWGAGIQEDTSGGIVVGAGEMPAVE